MKQKGFFQALGITLYISLIALFMNNANQIIGQTPKFIGSIAFLLLFSTSALVCALIVFYKPYLLFFSGHKKDAINLVVQTTIWLFVFLSVALTLAISLNNI